MATEAIAALVRLRKAAQLKVDRAAEQVVSMCLEWPHATDYWKNRPSAAPVAPRQAAERMATAVRR